MKLTFDTHNILIVLLRHFFNNLNKFNPILINPKELG
jgi:hypothetical protein